MKKLSIYIHCASDLLTDHESHGEGLICFSILNALAKRGHKIWAFTPKAAVIECHENLTIIESTGPMPVSSLSPWKYSFEANKVYNAILKNHAIDIVWRMNPIGHYCPVVPKTHNCPLITGPIYYDWPNEAAAPKSRYGISIAKFIKPFGIRGWIKSLSKSKVIICATKPHADEYKDKYNKEISFDLPLIVAQSKSPLVKPIDGSIKIVFLANLLPYKRPLFFCEVINNLVKYGHNIEATIIGDGPERGLVEKYIKDKELNKYIMLKGKVPNNKVFDYLEEAHFFINTAVGEPYGRSIIESMSKSCIIVSHNSGGPKDFIKDGKTGLLIKGESPKDFTDEISKLIENPSLMKKVSQDSFEQTLEWSEDKIISKLEDDLNNLLA